jgi:signal peptidase I
MARKNDQVSDASPPKGSAKNTAQADEPKRVEETPAEFVASICSVLVVGLFILTFLGQNFVIPSGSMENTLLIGDHLAVDRITLAPAAMWMPLVHYREPQRGDIVVFIKPVIDPVLDLDSQGNPTYSILVKRLIGVPGDHIHLRDGVVFINGVAQNFPPDAISGGNDGTDPYRDDFPRYAPNPSPGGVMDSWADELPKHVVNGELVVPEGHYFMMGDHRHNSLDSRYWGFVPRENIMGRPLFNYWSFEASEAEMTQAQTGGALSWMGHVALHFFDKTRWSRTFKHVK